MRPVLVFILLIGACIIRDADWAAVRSLVRCGSAVDVHVQYSTVS